MRTRRWLTWLVFGICALAVLEGLGWVTWQALRAERRELQARADADFQESVRLALWRMESQATPIIAQESARPYFEYRSFYPAERAYNRMWQQVEKNEVLVPSPLLESSGQCIRLHYQVEPDGSLTSPQAPTGNMLDLAESQYVDSEFLVLASQNLSELGTMLHETRDDAKSVRAEPKPGLIAPERSADAPERGALDASEKESQARQQAYQIANSTGDRRSRSEANLSTGASAPAPAAPAAVALKKDEERASPLPRVREFQAAGRSESEVEQGTFQPFWRTNPKTGGDELLFQRTVRVQGTPTVQGFWLDWPALKTRLLAAASDLLPQAQLRPTRESQAASTLGALRLASIPAELVPGPAPALAARLASPAHTTLAVTWLAVLAAIVAIAVVLRTSMELGDRRGRFVSAVTHELRTPLTTFCLYAEMLADGIVREEPKRSEYLGTLKTESRRLAGIVENVLDYARLGGRRRGNGRHTCTVAPLLQSTIPVLTRCAQQGGMTLTVDSQVPETTRLEADPQTVERILLNLVDNACKYAAGSGSPEIHLTIAVAGPNQIAVSLTDHGPGIPRSDTKRIFGAFHRVKRDADGPKSGLGLGLALSRGLARDMGGDLVYEPGPKGGSRFSLLLRSQ